MKLLNCYVENFGKLRKCSHTFTDGLNVFEERNGWGKSTLAAFIKVMLYGIPASRSGDLDENERRRYLPWNGEVCGGSLSFETNGSRYRVERIFGKKESEDVFRLFSIDTGMPSDDYSSALGVELFGIDAAGYERSTCFSHKQLEAGGYTSVQSKLSEQNDLTSYDLALAILDRRRKYYQLTGRRGRVAELDETASTERRILENAESDRRALGALSEAIREAENAIHQKQAERERLLVLAERAKAAGEGRLLADSAGQLRRARDRAEEECDRIRATIGAEPPEETRIDEMLAESRELDALLSAKSSEAEATRRRSANWRRLALAVFALGVLALIPAVLLEHQILALAAGAVALVSVFAILPGSMASDEKRLAVKHGKKLSERLRRRSEFLAPYADPSLRDDTAQLSLLREKRGALTMAEERLRAAETALADFLAAHPEPMQTESSPDTALNPSELTASAEKLAEEIKADRERLLEKQHQARGLESSAANISIHLSNLAVLEEEKRNAEAYLSAILRAEELLTRARDALTVRYRDVVESAFRRYLTELDSALGERLLSDEGGDTVTVSGGFEISVTKGGTTYPVPAFSRGYRDLLALCMRFSICDALLAEESAPMLLDDPFINLDDEKTAAALELLSRLSRERQILYFTCSHSRTPAVVP